MISRTGIFLAAFFAVAMSIPSGGLAGCAHAQSAASLTELSSGAGAAIVRDLERRGTPRGNYKISKPMTISSSTQRLTRKVRDMGALNPSCR